MAPMHQIKGNNNNFPLSNQPDADKTPDSENRYFKLGTRGQVTPMNVAKMPPADNEAVKPANPMLTYKAVDSPGGPIGTAPFAAKVAEQLRKSQENIENDVYGLDQKSPVRQPGEDPKYSLQMSKQHPTLHENKLLVLKSPPGKSDDKPSKVKIVARALEEVREVVHNANQSPQGQPANQLDSDQLYKEVVKQLSKDSYGVGGAPISKEVISLLTAQQEHIKEQEKKLQEFQNQLRVNNTTSYPSQQSSIASLHSTRGINYGQLQDFHSQNTRRESESNEFTITQIETR